MSQVRLILLSNLLVADGAAYWLDRCELSLYKFYIKTI